MNYEGLDELSHRFARKLFSAFPAWTRFARTINGANGITGIQIEVVQDGSNRILQLSTTADEITIRFEGWHTHVGPFLGIDIEESVETAIRIIESLVSEETVVMVAYRDGKWIGSSLSYRVAPSKPTPNSTTKIFSWRGTYDDAVQNP